MNDFDILADKILKHGRVAVYFQKDTPYLSLRITVPQDTLDAEFLQEFKDYHGLGTIQHLSKSTILIITGKNAENLLALHEDVGGTLILKNPELYDIIYEYHTIMENKRKGGAIDMNEIYAIREKLQGVSGASHKRKSVENCEPREVDEEFLKRFGMEEEYEVEE